MLLTAEFAKRMTAFETRLQEQETRLGAIEQRETAEQLRKVVTAVAKALQPFPSPSSCELWPDVPRAAFAEAFPDATWRTHVYGEGRAIDVGTAIVGIIRVSVRNCRDATEVELRALDGVKPSSLLATTIESAA